MSANGSYSTRHASRAYPAASIRFVHPIVSNLFDEVDALIDSGASGTLIPKTSAETLGLTPINRAEMRDYRGVVIGFRPVYYVTVVIDSLTFTVNAAETEGEAIIGRDILNKLTTTLRGVQQKWEMK